MTNVNEERKPLALLTNDVQYALVWALNKYANRVEMYSLSRRTIIANGRTYIICNKPEDLYGIEIERYIPCFTDKATGRFRIDMERIAKTRVR